ncbi:MAG: extracellular solute-binding protein family 7 bacteria [Syntrophaceae bacterium]|nr:MAG: extracellular solute-binding protein family 7 bacteria [Syntrophaceae bacterium]
MKRKLFYIVLVSSLMIFAAGAVFAQPADQKVYKWNFQSHWPAGSASFKPLKDFFDQNVSKMTNGRLLITLHPAGSMVPSKDIFAVCRKGTIEGATAAPIYWMSIIPIAAVAANCPMTFRTAKEGLYFHFNLGFEQMLKDAHAKHNLLYYTEKIYPTAMIGKKPIRKVSDFKGYKIRSSGAIAEMLKDLGAAPTLIPGEELYLALQTGVIDGAHWGAASGALTMKLPEVAKYYIQPDLAMSGTDVIIINKDAFNALPKDLQTILDKALKDRVYQRSEEYIGEEKKALETMIKDYKVTVSTLEPADQKIMMVAAMKQWDKVAAKDAESAKAIGMLKDYLRTLKYID